MSRGKRYTRKQRKINKIGKEAPVYCPKCHVQVPISIYDRDDGGLGYTCPMCGTAVFAELKELLEKIDEKTSKEK